MATITEDNEQKLAGKVEPKFKVGDWIVQGHNILKIRCVGDKYYCFETVGGYVDDMLVSEIDSLYHLWTIQDAKEGDVLVCKGELKYSDGIKYERICLFNNLDNAFFTLTKTSNFVEEYDIDVNIDYPDNTVPATKKQKEILFMAMADAGYTFDFEKKELKKIEQKHTPKHRVGDTIYYNSFGELKSMIVANVVTDSTDNPMYEDKEGNAVFEKDIIEQNPTWSEEDERMYRGLHNLIYSTPYCDSRKELSSWLEFLKYRVQPRQEWSEEDKDAIDQAILALEDLYDDDCPLCRYDGYKLPYDKAAKRLESLKDRAQQRN